MGQSPHRNWSVGGPHAAKLVAGYERRRRAEFCRAARGEHTSRSGTNDDDVHHSPSVTLALVKAASCVLATKGGMAWAEPAAFVLVARVRFRLLLKADVPEERENDRIDLFRSLFRRLVTNARHDDDVPQIAEIRSERIESGALPVDAEHWPG